MHSLCSPDLILRISAMEPVVRYEAEGWAQMIQNHREADMGCDAYWELRGQCPY